MCIPFPKRAHRLWVPIAMSALVCIANGQSSIASYNGLHAIVGARIEIGDGRVIEKGTVVIRDGMIVAVAADAAVPRGADIVDGKGLTIYPGFIDAYTTKGYKAPAESAQVDPDVITADYAPAFMRENVRKGITPENRATANLALTDDLLKSYRGVGFTTILVAPSGGDLSGVASLINLSGRPARESIVVANVGETLGFGGRAWGAGYPGSLLGHIAQLRQTFLDAQWYRSVDRSFQAGGFQRPPSDDALVALQPVIAGKVPVIFDADSEYQIVRSLDIASEFQLKPIIAGGNEAWTQVDALKKAEVPVLLSIFLSKEPSEAPPSPEKTEPAPVKENSIKLAERKRLYAETVKNASLIAKAGIPFALTTKGGSPTDFMANLRKAVEAGLSKEAALKSLTIDSAKIFGVDRQLGTIEVGKIANVIVLSGDFLKADTKVKMVYIDGRKFDPSKATPAPAPRMRFGGEDGN